MLSKFRTNILAPAFVGVGILLVGLTIYIAKYQFNIAALIGMNAEVAGYIGPVPESIPQFLHGGNDGGYNFGAARDPFVIGINREPNNFKAVQYALDRWLYQVMSWSLAFGKQEYLPYSMVGINVAAVFFWILLCSLLVKRSGYNIWFGLLCGLNIGVWQPLRFSFVDPLFVALGLGSVLFYLNGRKFLTATFVALATLTRFSGAGFAIVFAIDSILKKRPWHTVLLYIATPLPYFLFLRPWIKYVGHTENLNSVSVFDLPYAVAFRQITEMIDTQQWLYAAVATISCLCISLLIFLSIAYIFKIRKVAIEPVIVIGFCMSVICLNAASWNTGLIQLGRLIAMCFPLTFIMANTFSRPVVWAHNAFLFFSTLGGFFWLVLSAPISLAQ